MQKLNLELVDENERLRKVLEKFDQDNKTAWQRVSELEDKLVKFTDAQAVGEDTRNVNMRQVGGSHYRMPVQPWDFINVNGLSFMEGSIVSYVCRYSRKHELMDLQKSKHYIEKMIDLHVKKEAARQTLNQMGKAWELSTGEVIGAAEKQGVNLG